MNERDLRYLIAVAESGTLQAAAERAHVTQPALTKCIRRLEDQVGSALFERRGGRTVLTEAGDVLVRRARLILHNIDDTWRELNDHAGGRSGHVRFGAAATLTEFLVPDLVAQLSREAPGVTIKMTVGMSDVLREALRNDELDLVLGPVLNSDEFDCTPIQSDEVVVVAGPSHPLAHRRASIADLHDFGWVLPPRSVALRVWLDQAFEQSGLSPPRVQVEVNSLALMPELIARTELLSFLSTRNLHKNKGVLIGLPIKELTYRREFGILSRKGGYLPLAAQTLVRTIKIISRTDKMLREAQ